MKAIERRIAKAENQLKSQQPKAAPQPRENEEYGDYLIRVLDAGYTLEDLLHEANKLASKPNQSSADT